MKEIVVYAYVVADLLHVGHIIALENAKIYGDKLIVVVLTILLFRYQTIIKLSLLSSLSLLLLEL